MKKVKRVKTEWFPFGTGLRLRGYNIMQVKEDKEVHPAVNQTGWYLSGSLSGNYCLQFAGNNFKT